MSDTPKKPVQIEYNNFTWDCAKREHTPMPDKMKAFLADIIIVCSRHGLSLSHEDGHGAFIVQDYSEKNIEWLLEAHKDFYE